VTDNDALQSLIPAMLFKQFKVIVKLGVDFSKWQTELDS
jgi:hypothetical protein